MNKHLPRTPRGTTLIRVPSGLLKGLGYSQGISSATRTEMGAHVLLLHCAIMIKERKGRASDLNWQVTIPHGHLSYRGHQECYLLLQQKLLIPCSLHQSNPFPSVKASSTGWRQGHNAQALLFMQGHLCTISKHCYSLWLMRDVVAV